MLDYRNFVETVISHGGYVLSDMEERINKLWLEGKLPEGDREALMKLAAERAVDADQVDLAAKVADLEHRVYELEHPTDRYAVWEPGYQTKQHETVRFDVTGDGEYDLCRYDGGRSYTALSIGKIDGWHLVDREGNATYDISRDASGDYVLTPVAGEPSQEPDDGE